MSDLARKLEQARKHVEPAWTPERSRLGAARLERAIVVRKRRRQVAAVGGGVLAVAAAIVLVMRPEAPGASPVASRGTPASSGAALVPPRVEAPAPLLAFEDGSKVFAMAEGARVVERERAPGRVVVAMEQGHAQFDVAHDPARVFEVHIDGLVVSVLGTSFRVERRDAAVHAEVLEGTVRVLRREAVLGSLGAGESATYPFVEAPAVNVEATEDVAAATTAAVREPSRRNDEGWRRLARAGSYREAYDILRVEPRQSVRNDPEDLLLASDVARLSGHPAEAVPHLEQLLRDHPRDARTSLAAFTLGRVLLSDLGRPREAAAAFRRAADSGATGALAEDALAREVEAYWRAGDQALAEERARVYLSRYPDGRRARVVREQGGVR